jgi:hypothetical protein
MNRADDVSTPMMICGSIRSARELGHADPSQDSMALHRRLDEATDSIDARRSDTQG